MCNYYSKILNVSSTENFLLSLVQNSVQYFMFHLKLAGETQEVQCPANNCGREVIVPKKEAEIKPEDVVLDKFEWRLKLSTGNLLNICELNLSLVDLCERVEPGSV